MGEKKVLVVDDELAWRKLLSRLFSARGYSVVTAASCAEGVAAAARERPDCAVLDFNLGDGTAGEVCRALRGLGDRHIPVIIFSCDPAASQCLTGEYAADLVIYKDSPVVRLPRLMDFFFPR